jgi:tetratricopeptide (TPR) repeat protein
MDDDEALFHRAVELRLAGSWTAALAALDDYVARARAGGYRVPEALKQRGEILEGLGRIEEALVAYEKVLGDPSIGPGAPEWAEALFRRGRLLLARGDCRSGDDGREALEDFLERYAAQPRPALETFEAGALLVRAAVAARRPDDARELLERIEAAAARLSPGERAGQEEHLARARRLAERKGGP